MEANGHDHLSSIRRGEPRREKPQAKLERGATRGDEGSARRQSSQRSVERVELLQSRHHLASESTHSSGTSKDSRGTSNSIRASRKP